MKGDCVYVVKAIHEVWSREGTYDSDDSNLKEFVAGVFDSKEAANKWIDDNTNFVLPKVDGKPDRAKIYCGIDDDYELRIHTTSYRMYPYVVRGGNDGQKDDGSREEVSRG